MFVEVVCIGGVSKVAVGCSPLIGLLYYKQVSTNTISLNQIFNNHPMTLNSVARDVRSQLAMAWPCESAAT